jgi:cytidine deaminase
MDAKYQELIDRAQALSVAQQLTDEASSGLAGSALLTRAGSVYTGKSLSGSCGISFCGEVGAVLEMLKNGETQIDVVVTVSNDAKLMPPCGRCRELMYEVDRANLDAKVVLMDDKVLKLGDIFPERWQDLWEATS